MVASDAPVRRNHSAQDPLSGPLATFSPVSAPSALFIVAIHDEEQRHALGRRCMGLIAFLRRLFFPRAAPPRPTVAPPPSRRAPPGGVAEGDTSDTVATAPTELALNLENGPPSAAGDVGGRQGAAGRGGPDERATNGAVLDAGAVGPPRAKAAGGRHESRQQTRQVRQSGAATNGRPTEASGAKPPVVLVPLRFDPCRGAQSTESNEVSALPYRFARFGVRSGGYLDLSRDGDADRLRERGLPILNTPEDLANWLELPLGKVAWLIHRFSVNSRPATERDAHYHFRWVRKRSGGWRLIESPKSTLKAAQSKILEEILNRVSAHPAAHGFVPGRSIVSNASPHVGQTVLVRFDLSNFYPSVTLGRVAAIFRGLGYSREAAVWLARLCTSAVPSSLTFPGGGATGLRPYLRAHLPQGAPTSPALANLSAFSLDVRLNGLARTFGATYTRYADDLTFSGPSGFLRALPTFLPLVEQIIQGERFRTNRLKRRVVRRQSCQAVTGVVVNDRPNIRRRDYDQLKAILTNCARHGWRSQNREKRENFAAWLRGRIAHVQAIHPERGAKLLAMFQRVRWD